MSEVIVSFYGPIVVGWSAPLRFERRLRGSLAAFTEVAASEFRVIHDPEDPRRLRISSAESWGGFVPGWEYRVWPAAGLTCATSSLPASPDIPYLIDFEETGCPEDIDQSGYIDTVEVLLILAFWGPAETSAAQTADINGDGNVGIDDLLQILACWGPCG